jgi:hypothetical protein
VTRIVVTEGGTPTDEELAALAIALSSGGRPELAPLALPPWRWAAMLEATGAAAAACPADLERVRG